MNSKCVQQEARKTPVANEVAVAVAQLLEQRDRNKNMMQQNLGTRAVYGQVEPSNSMCTYQQSPKSSAIDELAVAVVQLLEQRGNNQIRTYQGLETRPLQSHSRSSEYQCQKSSYLSPAKQHELYLQKLNDIKEKACFFYHQTGHVIRHCQARKETLQQSRQRRDSADPTWVPDQSRFDDLSALEREVSAQNAVIQRLWQELRKMRNY